MAKDVKKKNTNTKKNVKKNIDKKIGSIDSSMKNDLLKTLRIIFIVLVFLAAFYLLTVMIIGQDEDESSEETTIQYEEILAGSSFSMNDKEYLVLYYDKTDTEIYSDIYTSVTTYQNKDDAVRIYTVDMNNGFNKKYVSDGEGNSNPEEVLDLSINGPTLIKFVDGKVLEYIEGLEKISDYLS